MTGLAGGPDAGVAAIAILVAVAVNSATKSVMALSVGGGVTGMINDRVGVRGDLRYFRALQDNENDNDIDVAIGRFGFWRFTTGLMFKF